MAQPEVKSAIAPARNRQKERRWLLVLFMCFVYQKGAVGVNIGAYGAYGRDVTYDVVRKERLLMESRISIVTLGVKSMPVSIRFYRDGLGFDTDAKDDWRWAIFRTAGTRFALYPRDKLAEDIGIPDEGRGFGGITLAHNTRTREEVDLVIRSAVEAGGRLLKAPCVAGWGGYSGYFADPDGYPWEVAWAADWAFDRNGTLWGGSLGPKPKGTGEEDEPGP